MRTVIVTGLVMFVPAQASAQTQPETLEEAAFVIVEKLYDRAADGLRQHFVAANVSNERVDLALWTTIDSFAHCMATEASSVAKKQQLPLWYVIESLDGDLCNVTNAEAELGFDVVDLSNRVRSCDMQGKIDETIQSL